MSSNSVPVVHQQIFDLLTADQKQFFYIHNLWQGVSCIRLKSGVMKQFVASGGESQMGTFLAAATHIIALAASKGVWTCVRFSNNGYQSVLVYLGTRNIDEFMRLSKIRQAERNNSYNAHLISDDGILDEDGNPYGDRG